MAVHTFGCQDFPQRGRGGWGARNFGLTIQLSRSRLSITQRYPSLSVGRGKKKKRRRLLELAKPKANWKSLRDK